jgi:hypothetical protein
LRAALSVERRADLATAAVLGSLFLWLYLATLCRTVYWSDSAEYATAAYTLGVPHPPGYPLYTWLAHGFTLLFGPPALAVNAMSAVFGALAVALCFALARALGADRGAAAGAGALLGSSDAFWHNATVAEVYTPGLCFALGVALWLLRARARADARAAIAAAGLAGLGLGVHYSLTTLGLGFALLAAGAALGASDLPEHRTARVLRVARVYGACAAAAIAGFIVACTYFAFGASSDGVPNYAGSGTPARMIWLLSGGNYRLWFLHDFDAIARARYVAGLIATELSVPGLLLALAGCLRLGLRSRTVALAVVLAVSGNVVFFFRYRVDDLEVFLLPGIALLCACAGVAVTRTARAAGGRWHRIVTRAGPVVLAALALTRVAAGYERRDLSDFTAAADYGERLSAGLPRGAVILNYTTPPEWRYDAVFGMYFQHVLGRRNDVIVVKNADRAAIERLLERGRPVYLYAPVEHVAREYALEPEGELLRVTGRR